MTLAKHAYLVFWPDQLVSLGEALARNDLDALRSEVERFPVPEFSVFYRSDPEEPEYFTRITAYRILMPLLYYLLQFQVPRDHAPYELHRVCHDIQALSADDLARLGIRIKPRNFMAEAKADAVPPDRIADKQTIVRQLQRIDQPFRYPDRICKRVCWPWEHDNPLEDPLRYQAWSAGEVPGVSDNPFNDLLIQLMTSGRDQAWCFSLLDQALRMGAAMDSRTLYHLARVNDAWFRHLETRISPDVLLEARGLSYSERDAICTSPHALALIRGGRVVPPEPGKDGWLQIALSLRGSVPERARFVIWLVREGVQDVNHRGEKLSPPLKRAVYQREPDLTQCLIDLGADLNLADDRGDTPLHSAAWLGYAELVEQLVQHGADMQIRNQRGKTPKDVAEAFQHTGIVRFLTDSAIPDRKRDQ